MTAGLDRSEIERFRALVGECVGLSVEDGKLEQLAEILRERMARSGCAHFAAYERRLARGDRDEIRAIAERMTVGETYFFRYRDHFRAFADVVLDDRAARSRPRLHVLSAGCSSGEEAYSIAIAVREHGPATEGWDVKILGVDINRAAIERALHARYSAWSLRETPVDIRSRYFRGDGSELRLDERVAATASFEQRNLVEEDPAFWRPEAFDVVFFRNVMMYLTPEAMSGTVARITRCLAPGGYLFLGHAETLRGLSHDFHLCHTHETFYYRRREPRAARAAPVGQAAHPPPREACEAPAAALDPGDGSWVEAIQRASDRIARLAQSPSAGPPRPGPDPAPPAPLERGDLRLAVELLRQERFVDAMDLLQSLPNGRGNDPDAQLLRAALLTNSGRLGEAQDVCSRILAADELSAGAHYLMALCREHAGDHRAAFDHDQAASYLDAGFAMPHLHIGLMARRAGDHRHARTELGRALALLSVEDASRILIFGGGFSREALADLCRFELRASGGRP